MKQTKPHPAEVILAELMAASWPLDINYIGRRCAREAGATSEQTVCDLCVLRDCGIIEVRTVGVMSGGFTMTTRGRTLLSLRPPYNCYRAIRDELAACGPLMASELEHACRRQASDYCADVFMRTLYDMLQSGLVVDCTERGDAHSTYDLPEASE